MADGEPSSSSITHKWAHDVFLSYPGDEDTCSTFVRYLYLALCGSGIRTFPDEESFRTPENISPALSLRAMQESRIAIIVLSENYADSTRRLEQLVEILECVKKGLFVYPVFYHVDPSKLPFPRESCYAEALARLEERFRDNTEKVDKWNEALCQAAKLKGCWLLDEPKIANEAESIGIFYKSVRIENEAECIRRIINEVVSRISWDFLYVADYPVGLDSRVEEVILRLDIGSNEEIKMIGICGGGGMGKTTIARAVYNLIAHNFEAFCFLSNVREQSKSCLQETLMCKLLKMKKGHRFGSCDEERMAIMECWLNRKKILLVLDDVDQSNQLEALAGCDWFGCGSRIIITTRNKQLLVNHGVKSIYDVKGLNDKESLDILSWYAFKQKECVDSECGEEFYNRVIRASRGIPLNLASMGCSLRGVSLNHWRSALAAFKRIPHEQKQEQEQEQEQDYDIAANPTSSTMDFNLWEKTRETIGGGGFGIVHVGFNIETGDLCAIKEMRSIENLQTAISLDQEIHILSQLEHKNIVKYYGSQRVASQISIYMEYVPYGSLDRYIRSQRALQESLVRDFTAQILSGLSYLHSQSVIHRDIKPQNLLVDPEENVIKLADFGLAKHLLESMGNHSETGTLYYAAPELLNNAKYKSSDEANAADTWSLGCVVIEMFTGKHPWPDCDGIHVAFKVAWKNEQPEIPQNLSPEGKSFLRSCFTRDPAERPSAADLLSHPFVKTQT